MDYAKLQHNDLRECLGDDEQKRESARQREAVIFHQFFKELFKHMKRFKRLIN